MGLCSSLHTFEPDGDMTGVGEYKNLNPFMAKKESSLFRLKIQQILDSVRIQCRNGGGSLVGGGSGSPNGIGLGAMSHITPSSLRTSQRNRGYGGAGTGGGGGGGGLVEVVQAAVDDFGIPVEITETDLNDVSNVLRVFSTAVRDEIVGACLLARPKAYHAYGYDYSKSAVLTMRSGNKVCTAAVVTLRVVDSVTRCLEVSWVATLRDYRKRGHAALLFGYIQQIAAVMGIEAVIVLSSRTSVGYWLCQPRPPSSPRTIMVRHKHSDKRLTKGYSKMVPRKLQKLEAGLRRCEVFDEPPECVQKFYHKDSSFRFNFANSIHVWYLLGLDHVNYVALAKSGSMHHPSVGSSAPGSSRAHKKKHKLKHKGSGGGGGSGRGSGSSGGEGGAFSNVARASSELQAKFLKSAANSAARQAGYNTKDGPPRSRSLPSSPSSPYRPSGGGGGGGGGGSGGSGDRRPKRALSGVSSKDKYKVQSVAAAKMAARKIARKISMKAKNKRVQGNTTGGSGRRRSHSHTGGSGVDVPQTT